MAAVEDRRRPRPTTNQWFYYRDPFFGGLIGGLFDGASATEEIRHAVVPLVARVLYIGSGFLIMGTCAVQGLTHVVGSSTVNS